MREPKKHRLNFYFITVIIIIFIIILVILQCSLFPTGVFVRELDGRF